VGKGESPLEGMGLTATFWRGKRVFVTGHTGFKGAWLALWLARMQALVTGYALAAPTEPSLFEAAGVARTLLSLEGDVRDFKRLHASIQDASPEIMFHLAAQALVRPSYQDPVGTFSTNVMGTAHLLEACRDAPGLRAVIIVTSDKCYEEHPSGRPYDESDPLGGHDPYAASKACAEIVAAAYRQSFFASSDERPAIATARAGNVIGGGDWGRDRLVPDLIRAFCEGKRARVRNPGATRPWQHVLDPLAGYLALAERLHTEGSHFAGAWNFGPPGSRSATVECVANRVVELWGSNAAWEVDAAPQPREARFLALDPRQAEERLGWTTQLDLDTAIDWTISWYAKWRTGVNARELSEEQIDRFMQAGMQ
jgi:CDP-glucose 4,6-dehydratase